jgi:purine-binding chemotaxis protein CheW
MGTFSTDMPWVIFHLLDEQFAVSANHVREMVAMPKVVPVPQTPDYIRGVINLRDQVIPVMDLRLRMGMTSLVDETEDLIQLLDQREQDHKNWIAELESSVREQREFKLATDPHKCAFGKWYDNFKTENRILAGCLRKFDAPHQKIHAIAVNVKGMEEKEDFDSAYEIINRTKEGELAEMIRLFSEARSLLRESNREIALVLEWKEKTMAIGVDSVEAVEKFSESNIEDMPEVTSILDNECIAGVGKRGQDNDLVQLLDVGKIIGQEKDLSIEIPKEE